MQILIDESHIKIKFKYIKFLVRAHKKFSEKSSDIDKFVKALEKLESLPIKLEFNEKLETTLGFASQRYDSKGRLIGFLIELNKSIDYSPARVKYQLVSHEFAHIIDFLIRGSVITAHDEEWAFIHKLMGGTGTRLITSLKK